MRITDTHLFFWGSVYSQWAETPFKEDGKLFPTAEHYMMYHKALIFNDNKMAEQILKEPSARTVKKYGRKIKNFDNEVWNEHKMKIVIRGNILKFVQNPAALKTMRKHKDLIIVEASPYDKIWGIGLDEQDDRVLDESKWQGQNLLGIAIMEARGHILSKIIS